MDLLDAGEPLPKAWEEFRASFASALQQVWLLGELGQLAPGYMEGLELRLSTGLLNADVLSKEDPEYDGEVPIQGPSNNSVLFVPRSEAEEPYEQLFPHGPENASDSNTAYGLATVGLHSALEAYARALHIELRRRSLPDAICRFLRQLDPRRDLDASTADLLTECDATRHLVVHCRGIVDEMYVDKVKDNHLLPGERKRLDFDTVFRFARAVWQTARTLKSAAASIHQ